MLLGAPGSGKGTQAKLLVDKYKIPQIATGDLFRTAVSAGTELGRKAKAAMDAGQLVSDEIVLGIIQERLARAVAKTGFVLDGFPRNIPQAQALDSMLARLGQPLQLALLVDIDSEVLMKRLTGRRNCGNCGAIYNIYFSPPKTPGKCDKCAGVLEHRSDDNEDTVRSRLKVYDEQTAPLVSYYKAQGKLRTVRGVGTINDIFKNITDVIEAQIRPLAAVMGQISSAAASATIAKKAAAKTGQSAAAKAKAAAKPAAAKATPGAKKAVKAVKKAVRKAAKKAAKKTTAKKKVVRKAVKKIVKKIKKKKVAKKASKKARTKVKKKIKKAKKSK